jgi:drug/metabolite transporter (DMT)-like permease
VRQVIFAAMHEHTNARLRLAGAAVLFSTGGAAIKAAQFTSWQVASLRSGTAALALLLLLPAARRGWSWRAVLVGVAYAVTLTLFVLANKLTTSANTIFLQSTAPLYLLLLGPWLLRESVRPRDLGVMLAVAVGLLFFFLGAERPVATAPDPVRGNILAALSGVAWAFTVVGLRWLGTVERQGGGSGLAAVVIGNLLAFAGCLPYALPLGVHPARDWLTILYLGVFQIGLAYILVTSALRQLRAFEASMILLIEPALNPLWAWAVHGEVPGPWAFAGGAMILGATTLKTWLDTRNELSPEPGPEPEAEAA